MLDKVLGCPIRKEEIAARTTLVPNHGGEKIDRGLLNKIIKKDLGMERKEFLRLIR